MKKKGNVVNLTKEEKATLMNNENANNEIEATPENNAEETTTEIVEIKKKKINFKTCAKIVGGAAVLVLGVLVLVGSFGTSNNNDEAENTDEDTTEETDSKEESET